MENNFKAVYKAYRKYYDQATAERAGKGMMTVEAWNKLTLTALERAWNETREKENSPK